MSDRALFIDEGGESSSCVLMTALAVDVDVAEDARLLTEQRIDELEVVIPTLAEHAELHGIRLAKLSTPAERADPDRLLRDHERRFIYEHMLHSIGRLPGKPRVYTVRLDIPKNRKKPRKGHDVRVATAALVGHVARKEPKRGIVHAVIDEGSQIAHNRAGLKDVATQHHNVLDGLDASRSEDHRLVQLADLACYAAWASMTPASKARHVGMDQWFRRALSGVGNDIVNASPT